MSPRLLCLLALAACEPYDVGDPPEQLEAVDVALSVDVEAGRYEGDLDVVGGPVDYAFVHTDEDGQERAFEVHSPGEFDLAHIAGPDRVLHLLDGPVSGHQSVVVADGAGPTWVADLGDRAAAVSLLLGGQAVRNGETIYSDLDGVWQWTYTTLVVPTDEGDVELLPGEIQTVTIGGVYWRFAAVAAYKREPRAGAELSDCERMEDMLAYEMFRVGGLELPEVRERPVGEDPASLGCSE